MQRTLRYIIQSFRDVFTRNLIEAIVRFPLKARGNDRSDRVPFESFQRLNQRYLRKVLIAKNLSLSYLIILFLTLSIAFLSLKCKDEPTKPPDDTPKLGRRDYTWFVDTIYAGGNIIRCIDGVSPNDVWAISDPGDFSKTFYHFNGTKWTTDGVNRTIGPRSIHACASNNVWCVGLSGDIWFYDGNTWKSQIRITADSSNYYSLEDIDGSSSTDLYAVGGQGYDINLHPLVYQFNGNIWSRITVQDVVCSLYKIRFYSPGKALVIGLKNQNSSTSRDTSKIFLFDGNGLQEIYSAVFAAGTIGDIAKVTGGVLILKGTKLTFFNGKTEQDILTVQNQMFGNSIEARSTKDVFLGMIDGIAHYNGIDIQYLFNFLYQDIHGDYIKVFPNCIFVNTHNKNNQANIIYRGYLK